MKKYLILAALVLVLVPAAYAEELSGKGAPYPRAGCRDRTEDAPERSCRKGRC